MSRSLNPMKLLHKNSVEAIVKTGAGVYLYKVVSTQVDKKWLRWTCYGGMAMFGLYAPIAIASLNEIWPEWHNLDRQAPAAGGSGDIAAMARQKAGSSASVV